MKEIVIGDIDGCMADSNYPLEVIVGKENPDWDEFERRLSKCKLNTWAKSFIDSIPKDVLICFITARREVTRKVTEDWLIKNHIRFDFLFMSPNETEGNSAGIKKDIFDKKIKNKFDIKYAFDDTPAIIKMWEDLKVPCIPIYNPVIYED